MYRVLIVDDERIARESVKSLLETQNELEFEIWTADSAQKALDILQSERIDLAILDINMPQVSGLELYSSVRKNWRQCRVIFLTGYSEFNYVYQVHRHARYVLKAESDEVLMEAVRESIQELEQSLLVSRIATTDQDYRKRADWHRTNDFMGELLDGFTPPSVVTDAVLRDMNIDLEADAPVYCLLSRMESLAEADFHRRQVLYEQVQILLEKYFAADMRCVTTIYRRIYFFLTLQPNECRDGASLIKRLSELCSLYQTALQANMGLSAAIFIPDKSLDSFAEAIRAFPRIVSALANVDSGDTQVRSLSASMSMDFPREELSRRVKQYISRHLSDDVSVTALAEHFHFSREYIMRVFKKDESVTILQYVNDLKSQRAGELLTQGELSVKDIAQQTGFGGSGQFIRFFKSKTGKTPQAYREGRGGSPRSSRDQNETSSQ